MISRRHDGLEALRALPVVASRGGLRLDTRRGQGEGYHGERRCENIWFVRTHLDKMTLASDTLLTIRDPVQLIVFSPVAPFETGYRQIVLSVIFRASFACKHMLMGPSCFSGSDRLVPTAEVNPRSSFAQTFFTQRGQEQLVWSAQRELAPRLTVQRGAPDAAARVGKIFVYTIPADAFSVRVDKYQVGVCVCDSVFPCHFLPVVLSGETNFDFTASTS